MRVCGNRTQVSGAGSGRAWVRPAAARCRHGAPVEAAILTAAHAAGGRGRRLDATRRLSQRACRPFNFASASG